MLQTCSNFLKICVLLASVVKFLRGNLNCSILKTEDRRKLKVSEVSFDSSQNILKENRTKNFDLNTLLTPYFTRRKWHLCPISCFFRDNCLQKQDFYFKLT